MSLRTGRGSIVKSAKCNFHLLALWSGAINHLFVISMHSIKLMNALNRNMISLLKFHSFIVWFKDICLDLMFTLILPGSSSEITCRPGRYRGRSGQHVAPDLNPWNLLGNAMCSIQSAWPTTNPPWTMGCNSTDQDHQTDPQHEEKVSSYHGGIWRINTVLISPRPSIDLPGVALRLLALFTIDPTLFSDSWRGLQ